MKIKLGILGIVLMTTISSYAQNGKISSAEREFLLNFLDITETDLTSTISTMTDEQWNFKPTPEAWSPAQVMAHVNSAETIVFADIKSVMEKAEEEANKEKNEDAWLIGKVTDRGIKVKTPLENDPESTTKEITLKQFKDTRASIKEYLTDKKLALRSHYGKSPYGPADAYQMFLVIAAHSQRHHAQMQEVLALAKK